MRNNDILRGGEKIGWFSGNDVYDEKGIKLGYFRGDDIFERDGDKIAYIEGEYLVKINGTPKISMAQIEREIRGNLSEPQRAMIKLFF